VKTILLAIIIIGSVVGFWFGLQAGLRTQYPLLTVASGSMIPTLNVGDLIVVQGIANFSEVKAGLWKSPMEGDIIIFHRQSSLGQDDLIVHRAIEKYQGTDDLWYFKTAGDNNKPYPSVDSWIVSERSVVGKVVGKVPLVGYIPLEIRKPYGMALIVILIFILILAEYLPALSKKEKTTEG